MRKPNILLAEDHPTNTLIVQMVFKTLGLAVTCVENGEDAVRAASLAPFDLVLMDVKMPVMDGHTAIREIRAVESRAHRPPSRIYTVTTNDRPEDADAAFAAGADGHITKPYRIEALLDALASVGVDEPQTASAAASVLAAR
jgi:CheY-like chemotaxis protein